MEKYIKATEATVKALEAFAVVVLLAYGIICFERWQRPEGMKVKKEKRIVYSVDTIKGI
jgi:hypothetical protein